MVVRDADVPVAETDSGGLIARARRIYLNQGFLSLWLHFLQWTGFYRSLLISTFPLRTEEAPINPALTFGKLDAEQLHDYVRLRPDKDLAPIRERLVRGDTCTTLRSESGELIAVGWDASPRVWLDFLECGIEFGEESVYFYDQYVGEANRRSGVSRALEVHRSLELRAIGISFGLATIWSQNRVAVERNFREDGAKIVGKLSRYSMFGFRWIRLKIDPGGISLQLQVVRRE